MSVLVSAPKGEIIVFDTALPRQKHPEASKASPRADQTGLLAEAMCDEREKLDCETKFYNRMEFLRIGGYSFGFR